MQRPWYALEKMPWKKLLLTKSLASDGDNRNTLCFFYRVSAYSNAASWNFPLRNNEKPPVSEKILKELLDLRQCITENAKKHYRNLKYCADCEEIL